MTLTPRGQIVVTALATIAAVLLLRPAAWLAVNIGDLITIAAPVAVPVMVAVPLWLALLVRDTRNPR